MRKSAYRVKSIHEFCASGCQSHFISGGQTKWGGNTPISNYHLEKRTFTYCPLLGGQESQCCLKLNRRIEWQVVMIQLKEPGRSTTKQQLDMASLYRAVVTASATLVKIESHHYNPESATLAKYRLKVLLANKCETSGNDSLLDRNIAFKRVVVQRCLVP